MTITKKMIKDAGRGNLEKVKSLVKLGADVNGSIEGRSALLECSSNGNLEIVKYLIEQGADVNFKNETVAIISKD